LAFARIKSDSVESDSTPRLRVNSTASGKTDFTARSTIQRSSKNDINDDGVICGNRDWTLVENREIGEPSPFNSIYDARRGEVIRVPIVVHVPPDVTAQIFWLENRDPKNWRACASLPTA
jgi:hypothetical protein